MKKIIRNFSKSLYYLNGLVEITIEAFNQKGELVLKDVTEAVVKCRPLED